MLTETDVHKLKQKILQKSLRKPENWQDFESLCKKLWGEILEIPHKIKKNGRLGQLQNGVDVYGIPKGQNAYWGVQSKGKSDYLDSKLTKKEIDKEIKNAKSFLPKLEVFIIATTQSKDVRIEEYVRQRDIENRNENSFEIMLFCWEDIADLIEENRETSNWYLGINNYREKFDISVTFSNGVNIIKSNPEFSKEITKYKVQQNENRYGIPRILFASQSSHYPFQSKTINKSWCLVEINIKNTGNVVLEDWYLNLYFDNTVRKIGDGFYIDIFTSPELIKMKHDQRTLFAYDEDKYLLYEPVNKEPLIQKTSRTFTINYIPKIGEKQIKLSWVLFARDFDKKGELIIELEPILYEKVNWITVENENDLKEESIVIKEHIEDRK